MERGEQGVQEDGAEAGLVEKGGAAGFEEGREEDAATCFDRGRRAVEQGEQGWNDEGQVWLDGGTLMFWVKRGNLVSGWGSLGKADGGSWYTYFLENPLEDCHDIDVFVPPRV